MQAILVQSGGKTACYISDLIPTSQHLDLNWVMSYDLYPLETIESRKRYYAQAVPEKWLTMFTHDAKLPWAYVAKDEKGRWWEGEGVVPRTRANEQQPGRPGTHTFSPIPSGEY